MGIHFHTKKRLPNKAFADGTPSDYHLTALEISQSLSVSSHANSVCLISRALDLSMTNPIEFEVSVVIPCLNEHETVGLCVQKALETLRQSKIAGEVLVADNGSTDGSIEIASELGARVVAVSQKGYGSALIGGIQAAQGKFVIMGDADDSYDFREIPKFVTRLREGYDLVQGCRLPWGGGTVKPGAMPFSHRWIGNPMFTIMSRWMFHAPINDIYCGMRGFRKEMFTRLNLRCTGMEFATEMIIKASLFGERIAEVPITLWPDGRKLAKPHLRTFRDGWRTLRFFVLFSPKWLFWYPGLLLTVLGLLGYLLALPGVTLSGVTFDAHTLLVSSMCVLLGEQAVAFAVITMAFSIREEFRPPNPKVNQFFQIFTLERGIVFGLSLVLPGLALLGVAIGHWAANRLGPLDYPSTMRLVIPGVTAVVLGVGLMFHSFLCSMLGLERRRA